MQELSRRAAWGAETPPGLVLGNPENATGKTARARAGRLSRWAYLRQAIRWERIGSLSSDEIQEVVDFYCDSFVDRSREEFREKLRTMDRIFRIRERDGSLRGFGTYAVIEVRSARKRHIALYAGWAGFAGHLRGLGISQLAALRAFLGQRARNPLSRIYCVFTASTYTSYLLLTNNFREFYPRVDGEPPTDVAELMRALGRQLELDLEEGSWILERAGTVRYREGIAKRDAAALEDPNVRAYDRLNPNQRRGDTLLCMAPLHAKNWWSCLRQFCRRERERSRNGSRSKGRDR